MYLGREEILKRIKKEKLLENFREKNIQCAGVDLEIEELYRIISPSFLGKEERRLPEVRQQDTFTLAPRQYYLCITREKVNMPSDLIAFIFPRSTLFRCGVSLRTAVVDPGYKGRLTIGIKNETEYEFRLERHARIAQIVFCLVKGGTGEYEGIYQGGKIV